MQPVCSKFTTAAALISTLERLGCRQIGEGYHSAVYRKGEASRVVKVNRSPDTNIDYYLWGHAAGHREVPRIFGARLYPDRTYAVVMEFLPKSVEDDPATWRAFDGLVRNIRAGKGRFARELRRTLPLHDWGDFTEPRRNCMVRDDGSLVLIDALELGDPFRVPLAYVRVPLAETPSANRTDAGDTGRRH